MFLDGKEKHGKLLLLWLCYQMAGRRTLFFLCLAHDGYPRWRCVVDAGCGRVCSVKLCDTVCKVNKTAF